MEILIIPRATALDTLAFMRSLIDRIGLEQMARMDGKTFDHPLAGAIGARTPGAISSIPADLGLTHQDTKEHSLTGPTDPIASSDLQLFMADFQAALIPLPKCVADSFNHCLLTLLDSARLEFTNSGHVVAGGACRGGVVLRIFGARELLAAALAAA